MQDTSPSVLPSRVPNTARGLLVLVGFILVGMSVGNILAVMLLFKFLAGTSDVMQGTALISKLLESPEAVPNGWNALMFLQAFSHVFTYLLPPLAYWFYIERRTLDDFQTRRDPSPLLWGMVLLLVLAFMPFNSLIVEWNAGMSLPDTLGGLEAWMREKEDQLTGVTTFLTQFDTIGQFWIALLVIGVLPAIGEEVLFRGVLQRKLMESWTNPHLAIWVTAALFSAIHVQFYGFFPRMLLGALFGYLYFWSGSLWVAIFAHFVNNGFMVLMLYLHHRDLIGYDIESEESVPWALALGSLAISVALIFYIRRVRSLST